jgi:hypothetical protein
MEAWSLTTRENLFSAGKKSMTTRKQHRQQQLEKIQAAMSGTGSYLYQNITGADLILPRATKEGKRFVGPREQFIGDSYFKNIKELVCLKEIQEMSTEQPQENKLILDQPETYTDDGMVEFVEKKAPNQKPLNENKGKKKDEGKKTLLTEQPVGSVRLIS